MALSSNQREQVIAVADDLGIPWDLALGLVDKESAGRATYDIGGKQLPAIRIEGHQFYNRLKAYDKENGTDLLKQAVAAGLAAPKQGAVKNSNNMAGRYEQFARMKKIHPEIAAQSTSIGIGQVMGFNHKRCGYESALDMFESAFAGGFPVQVKQFLNFIASDPALKKAANAYAYETIAKLYNGKSWKTTNPNYASELRKFTEKWGSGNPQDKRPAVDYEQQIKDLGYPDVRAFQRERSLKADGIIGPLTKEQINVVIRERKAGTSAKKSNGKAIATAGAGAAVATGTVLAEAGVTESIGDVIQNNSFLIDMLRGAAESGTTILVVVAGGMLAIGAFILIRNWQNKREQS